MNGLHDRNGAINTGGALSDAQRGHKLLTEELLAKLPKLGSMDGRGYDAPVVVKFFDPAGSWTWYATEGELVDAEGYTRSEFERSGEPGAFTPADVRFFGFVVGFEGEFGYFSLNELRAVRGRMGIGVERDLHLTEGQSLREVLANRHGMTV